MNVQSYLVFEGRCEEAIEFYKKAVGAEVLMLSRFKDAPKEMQCSPGSENKVMHACLQIGDTQVMASDGRNRGEAKFEGFSLCLNAANEAEANKLFTALSESGEVTMPQSKTFFAKSFGMVKDRFGVHWMVIVPAEQTQSAQTNEKVKEKARA
jgi:PhnB protein